MNQYNVKELFDYRDGNLIWKKNRNQNVLAGMIAGSPRKDGAIQIKACNKTFLAHRLIWLWHYGNMPTEIDHKDGNKANNNIDNLRECNHAENMENKRKYKSNKSGYIGVSFHKKSGKWAAGISRKHLGLFSTPEEASVAYLNAKKQVHTFHPEEVTR